jgi:RNA polymerase sigma-70 factor (ECF subfamily)
LAGFIRSLQAVDASEAPRGFNQGRGAPLSRWRATIAERLGWLADLHNIGAITAAWEADAAAPAWAGEPVWLHGDLSAGNLLARDGRLSGVIDWGLLGAGDPACELQVAWSLFDAAGRAAFRDAMAVDAGCGDYLHMGGATRAKSEAVQDEAYARVMAVFGAALERLSRAYEADADLRMDLLQDIHLALWRSFARFDGRCSERTWVYRVAHNVAASHVLRRRRSRSASLTTLDEIVAKADPMQASPEAQVGDRQALGRLMALVQGLAPPDRQIVVLYLEGLEAAAIGEVCGLNPGAVATKIHRLKAVLARRFEQGGCDVAN